MEHRKTVEDAGGLAKARDCFCFCAFTSLRYSDYQAMKPYIDIAEKTKANAMKLFEQEMEK